MTAWRPADFQPAVEIALATFNGETYLAALLDSLFTQSFQDFRIIVADDGSTDGTRTVLESFSQRHPGRIRLLEGVSEGGALMNFRKLTEELTAPYMMFCDQDDIWLPDKIALSLARVRAIEQTKGAGCPILVHCDMTVVGRDLEMISPSLFDAVRLDPTRNSAPAVLITNVAAGCAMIANRALYAEARPVPAAALMHDHWFALVAASVGVIDCLPQSLILYRQHADNVIGVDRRTVRRIVIYGYEALFTDAKRQVLRRHVHVARSLVERFGDRMTPSDRAAAGAFGDVLERPWWSRFLTVARAGLLPPSLLRRLAMLWVITTCPRDARSRRER